VATNDIHISLHSNSINYHCKKFYFAGPRGINKKGRKKKREGETEIREKVNREEGV
jgi:hypothetical protein